MTKKGDEKLRQLIAEHPDLPLMSYCPSLPCDYDHYYLDVCGASIQSILKPDDVEKKYGYCGLDGGKYYWDEDEAVYEVAEWLFEQWWDEAMQHGLRVLLTSSKGAYIQDDALTGYCCADGSIAEFSEQLARAIVQDMPWQDYIIIDCW